MSSDETNDSGAAAEDPKTKARLEGWAADFKDIIDHGSASSRFDYLQNTFVMLLHKVQELEKNFRWASRKIEELEEQLRQSRQSGKP